MDADLKLHRRTRRRRVRRKAMIRGVYFLPSLATLGNACAGFAAIYVATLSPDLLPTDPQPLRSFRVDPITAFFTQHQFVAAVYLIALAMIFDALDGRLARITRHTTDFGGQLDSMADMVSFGVAPAILALRVFKFDGAEVPLIVSRLVFAAGMMYVACAALRLARFNVANEHGEQHHMSFLGLPSPGAAAAVMGLILMQQDLLAEARLQTGTFADVLHLLGTVATVLVPVVTLAAGLLMVSELRYPHVVNRLLRRRKSLGMLVLAVAVLALLIVQHRYVLGLAGLVLAFSGPVAWAWARMRRSRGKSDATPA